MLQPPFGARHLSQLRNELIQPGPRIPGTPVAINEMAQLAAPDQLTRPAGFPRPSNDNDTIADPRAALLLEQWHQRMIARARLYHFSGPLARHAWNCEEYWPPMRFNRLFPTRYGLVVFATPIEVPTATGTTPICALAWGPLSDAGWEVEVSESYHPEHNPTPRRGRLHHDLLPYYWHVRAFTLPTQIATPEVRAAQTQSLVEEFDLPLNCDPNAEEEGHTEVSTLYALPRMLSIAFDLAANPRAAADSEEPVDRASRRRAEKDGIPIPEGTVRTVSLRPRLNAHVEHESVPDSDGIYRRPAKYTKICWPVRDSIDPDTGEVKKRGKVYFRNPDLLDDDPSDVVHTGTLTRPTS